MVRCQLQRAVLVGHVCGCGWGGLGRVCVCMGGVERVCGWVGRVGHVCGWVGLGVSVWGMGGVCVGG